MKASLQPSVLQWARERGGLSIEDLAKRLRVDEAAVLEWEADGKIDFGVIEKLAKATGTAAGFLFLRKPPHEELPVSDFRRVASAATKPPSRFLLSTIYQCQRRQEWFREYLIAQGADPLPFVGKFTLNTPILAAAREIAAAVKIGPAYHETAKTWEDAMRLQIENIEDAGILVNRTGYAENYTHNTLSVDEFRGFALSDPYAPLIFINGADAHSAQMFTLAHEVVHVWLGASGVSNLEKTYAPGFGVETFCNSVAAEMLVPIEKLKADWDADVSPATQIERLARKYRVSRIVLARRAKDTGKITADAYARIYTAQTASTKKAGGGDYYLTKPYEGSRRLSIAVIQDARNGRTMFREAMNLLGIKSDQTFQKYAETLHIAF